MGNFESLILRKFGHRDDRKSLLILAGFNLIALDDDVDEKGNDEDEVNHEIEREEDEELIHFEDDQDEDESEALDSEDRGESRESARIVPALQDRPSADTDESETDEQEEEEPMIFANAYGAWTRSGDEYDLPVEDDEARSNDSEQTYSSSDEDATNSSMNSYSPEDSQKNKESSRDQC